jgi:hypothetical protein
MLCKGEVIGDTERQPTALDLEYLLHAAHAQDQGVDVELEGWKDGKHPDIVEWLF